MGGLTHALIAAVSSVTPSPKKRMSVKVRNDEGKYETFCAVVFDVAVNGIA
jgi:hypothetical protein